MALSKFTKDMAIISALDDEPNDVGGLTAAELKAKFDEAGQALKEYLNDTLTSEADAQFATQKEVQGVVLGQIPDGSLTADKFAPGVLNGGFILMETSTPVEDRQQDTLYGLILANYGGDT